MAPPKKAAAPAKAADAKKEYVISVTATEDASVAKYKKNGGHIADLTSLLSGVEAGKNWKCETDKTGRVIAAWPEVNKHLGHVDKGEWKVYIEAGTKKTVDRLWIADRKYAQTEKGSEVHVKVTCKLVVQRDAH